MSAIAKVFMNGGSQAIRLPKEFRFDSDELCIKRIGAAVLIFDPKECTWDSLLAASGQASDDFMAGGRDQGGPADSRKPL